jgi:hypothetical protein
MKAHVTGVLGSIDFSETEVITSSEATLGPKLV